MKIRKLLTIALSWISISTATVISPYYPLYHVAPIKGWMNDPNGFCVFQGSYHLFYQHNPYSSLEPGVAKWRHIKSEDLVHWVDEGIALTNDTKYDETGVFSGSALIEENVMYLYYTGNVNFPGKTPEKRQTQALATSTDGIHFSKYKFNPVIKAELLQPDIRDPKVWKHGSSYYMVLGNSFSDKSGRRLGRVILFKSFDKINWKQVSILHQSDGFLGYMWECPDFFEIGGRFVLLFSPQGVKPQGDRFRNLYQTGYFIGNFNYKTYKFNPITDFRELDHGHDFYATQTILDNKGRRVLVAWMDMWKNSYPEGASGFSGQMIFLRSLSLSKDNQIIQKPIDEIVLARGKLLFSGKSCKETKVILPNKTGDIFVTASQFQDFSIYIGSEKLNDYVEIKYEALLGRVSLKRDNGNDGLRRTKFRSLGELEMRILIDSSSIEVFVGKGIVTFSSRFFIDDIINVRIGQTEANRFEVYDVKKTLYNS